jgi:hypothetical protein
MSTSQGLSLFECRDFLAQAATLLHTPNKDPFTASVSFLAEAERLLKSDQPPLLDECQAFLNRAESLLAPSLPSLAELRDLFDEVQRLLIPPTLSLEECQAFLETAEGHLLEHWRRQIELLQGADPRDRPDFQTVNLLEVFGISRKEKTHSRFLGWLLDPQKSHGLGTAFLDSFLRLAQRTCGREFEADLSDVKVKLERGTGRGVPDITVIGLNFLCIVENKLLAAEGQDQTRRYADAAEEEACKGGILPAHLLLVFLSPTGRPPKDGRFHALAYPPLLQLLEDLLNRDVPPIVEMAIRQFVFNLRTRILPDEEYDHAMAALTHLAGYAEKGDLYLREHWLEIERLIQTLQEVNNMSGFKGFSEIALLFAEKYDLVRAMTTTFENERKQLFIDLQNRIPKAPWFDSTRITIYGGGASVEVRLRNPTSEESLARIQIYLDASRLGRQEFNSDLRLIAKVSDIRLFKRRFEEAAAQQLLDALNVEDYKAPRSAEYALIRRDVPFELDKILDAMLEELERLQQFFPYVEQVYLDLVRDEGEGEQSNG